MAVADALRRRAPRPGSADQPTRTLPVVGAPTRSRLPRPLRGDGPWVILVAGLLVWAVTHARTGQSLDTSGPVLLAITAVSGLVAIAAALRAPGGARAWGAGTLLAGAALVIVTGASISWSVAPDTSWIETNRTLAYVALMAGGAAAARLAPGRWQAPLGGVLLGTTVVIVLGLASKVFPAAIDPEQVYARLQDPIGYWNGIGAIAAFALVLALWLGTRRTGYRPLNATAYPIAALAVLTLLLSYSRGSLIAAGIGALVWILLAPRRLHSLLVLVVGVLGGGFVGIWTFANAALSTDKVLLAARESAGAELGVLLIGTIVVLLAAGLAIEFATVFTGVTPLERRRLGVFVACVVAVIPVAGVALVATSDRGLGGSVSNAWHQLTDPDAAVPGGDPSRLTAASSFRSQYWRQARDVFEIQPLHGVGAGAFGAVQPRVRKNGYVARHAHGWIPQTLADLGWVGMLVSLGFGLAFVAAAIRGLGLRGPLRHAARQPERDGTAAAVAVVATFAVASMADWTWFVPGVALPPMLLAGWVIGRGAEAAFRPRPRPSIAVASRRTAYAAALLVAFAIGCFSIAQPWRSVRAQNDALAAIDRDDLATAEKRARDARSLDPLSTEADYVLAGILVRRGDLEGARRLYENAIELQPAIPDSWQRLASFELYDADRPFNAQRAAGIALRLAPTSSVATSVAVAASRRAAEKRQARGGGAGTTAPPAGTTTPPPATGTTPPATGTTPTTPDAGSGGTTP
ncbi:O-antigen ligase family protein [Patulibacter defluvii]|uniref:O-antigen ligase family protein n=1 Tax=Patulibacter defluvii TaxID=3095358 RepID=UPI002A751D6B|nr:O-antigen ligase family protein [Patulibacter sp. DM4]